MNDLAHELYGKIKDKKGEIESLQYRIAELEKPESKCEAKLSLVINRNIRGTSYYYISKSHVLRILNDEVDDALSELAELEKQYIAVL